MGQSAVSGAVATCTFGAAPSTLTFLPITRVTIEGRPAGTITDIVPMLNVAPFGMCMSMSNPSVAAATSAALGVLTPMPCTPAITGPWAPGAARTTLGGKPALVSGSTCSCAFGGMISMTMTGAVRTTAS